MPLGYCQQITQTRYKGLTSTKKTKGDIEKQKRTNGNLRDQGTLVSPSMFLSVYSACLSHTNPFQEPFKAGPYLNIVFLFCFLFCFFWVGWSWWWFWCSWGWLFSLSSSSGLPLLLLSLKPPPGAPKPPPGPPKPNKTKQNTEQQKKHCLARTLVRSEQPESNNLFEGRLRKLRETCRNSPAQISRQNVFVVPSYDKR